MIAADDFTLFVVHYFRLVQWWRGFVIVLASCALNIAWSFSLPSSSVSLICSHWRFSQICNMNYVNCMYWFGFLIWQWFLGTCGSVYDKGLVGCFLLRGNIRMRTAGDVNMLFVCLASLLQATINIHLWNLTFPFFITIAIIWTHSTGFCRWRRRHVPYN